MLFTGSKSDVERKQGYYIELKVNSSSIYTHTHTHLLTHSLSHTHTHMYLTHIRSHRVGIPTTLKFNTDFTQSANKKLGNNRENIM